MAYKVKNDDGAAPSAVVADDGVVTDAMGRRLRVKKPNPYQRMRLFRIIGSTDATNDPYMGYAALAISVTEIDGEAVTFPSTQLQIEALVQRLDDAGMEAVAGYFLKIGEAEKAEQEVLAEAKNS